jgi:rod shape-determining protein MreD
MIEVLQLGYVWLVQLVWRALPLVLTILLMLAANIPLHLLQGEVPAPDIALTSIFFWAMHGSAFMPPWAVFIVGAAQDLTAGTPLGFSIIIYLLAYGFTLTQRIFFKGRTGIGAWLGFALVVAISALLSWSLGMIVFERWLDPLVVVLQAGMTILFYPLFSRLFMLVRRVLTTAPETL